MLKAKILAGAMIALLCGLEGRSRASEARDATRPTDGVCEEPSPQEALAGLALDIQAIRAHAGSGPACLTPADPSRAAEEGRELQALQEQVTRAIVDACARESCVSNLYLPVCKLSPWGPPCMGGCSRFSLLADDALSGPRYFSKQRVHQCAIGYCHWVEILTNDRTGEQFVIDAWKVGGGAALAGSDRHASVLASIADFNSSYPFPAVIGTSDPRYSGFCKHPDTNPAHQRSTP